MLAATDNPIRKAAVFIRSLEPEAAATLLARLSADEAKALRSAIADLGAIEQEERQQVAQHLRAQSPETGAPETGAPETGTPETAAPGSVASDAGGVELQLSTPGVMTAQEATRPTPGQAFDGAPGHAPERAPTPPDDWFQSLRDADPAAIAAYLKSEQPRAAALVLTYLPAPLAAAVLDEFADDEQPRMIALMASQGDADPASLQVLAAGLSDWIRRQQEEHRRREDRLASIRALLAATPDSRRQSLISQLTQTDPEIAQSLGLAVTLEPQAERQAESLPIEPAPAPAPAPTVEPSAAVTQTPVTQPGRPAPSNVPSIAPSYGPAIAPVLSPEQLERLDERALAEALASLDGRTALLALATASDRLLGRIEQRLSRKAARDLRQRIVNLGATTLSEVDRAQQAFAAAAERVVRRRRERRVAPTR